ncbi:MAG: glycosyltransferase family 2 protein [Flavobacteriaceae bacterium]
MNQKGKKMAVISMARNAPHFVSKWISYYGSQFGFEHLYLFLDGLEQPLPENADQIHCFQIPHKPLSRTRGDKERAKKISTFANTLFEKYDGVIALDIDEFLVVDPKLNITLYDYLVNQKQHPSLSALGVDVIQHPKNEKEMNWSKPILSQRSYAILSDRYTKPIVAFQPVQWGAGFHRIKGEDFTIDPHLYLFHLGSADLDLAERKLHDLEMVKEGWKGHLKRRAKSVQQIQLLDPQGEEQMKKAQHYFLKNRKWYAWNKPAPLKMNPLVEIPERFKRVL